MASNRYIDPNLTASPPILTQNFLSEGNVVRRAYCTFAKAATDNDGSVIGLWRQLPGNLVPVRILLCADAIAGLTAVDCGLYKSNYPYGSGPGAVLVDNCFASAVDIHLGAASFIDGTAFNMLAAVGHASLNKRLFEYANEDITKRTNFYDLCLTFDTGGTNTGNISVLMDYIID